MTAKGEPIELTLLEDEYWWGGMVRRGERMPFGAHENVRVELCPNLEGNQGCPLVVSSKGRYVWSEEPFSFEFKDGRLLIDDVLGTIERGEGYADLRGACLAASEKFFPPSGRIPHELSFLAPQYNAWIDMLRFPTQEKVLGYARAILDADMPPGILMIDDYWYKYNGLWKWDPEAFPRPREMVDKLHRMGFVVTLWVSPFLTSDTRTFMELREKNYVLRRHHEFQKPTDTPLPAIFRWWHGWSGMMDLSNPEAFAWFQAELDELVEKYGIDGFKFDGGDPWQHRFTDTSFTPQSPNAHCEDFARLGLKYDIAEYRACWKLGGQHLLQRVRDKGHQWDADGLADLIPTALAQGLVGYPYTCPDMVGGGEDNDFTDGRVFEQDLFIRWAQLSTFFPVIQYSRLPSRVLDAEHLELCMKMVDLRMKLGPEILELARHASHTGEPIMRHMAYEFPGEGMERIRDQYMLGSKYLVAPVMLKNAESRRVRFPSGKWRGDDGSIVEGPRELEVKAPLGRLPWYTRID